MIKEVIFLGLYVVGIYLSYKRKNNENNLKYIHRFFLFMAFEVITEIIRIMLSYNVELFYEFISEKSPIVFGNTMFVLAVFGILFDTLAFVQIIIFVRKKKIKR